MRDSRQSKPRRMIVPGTLPSDLVTWLSPRNWRRIAIRSVPGLRDDRLLRAL
jgi:hypothetical protein